MARRSIVCARRSKYARDDQKRDNDLKKDIHNGCSSSYKNADICSFNVFKNICQVLCHRTHWLSLVTVRVMVVTKFRLHTMVNDIEDLFWDVNLLVQTGDAIFVGSQKKNYKKKLKKKFRIVYLTVFQPKPIFFWIRRSLALADCWMRPKLSYRVKLYKQTISDTTKGGSVAVPRRCSGKW